LYNCILSYDYLTIFVCIHTIFVCVQTKEWCAQHFDEIMITLSEADDEDDFKLTPVDLTNLRSFIFGKDFDTILTALDTDDARVEARRKEAEKLADFKEYRRYQGLQELHRWVGGSEEYNDDDYSDFKMPGIPMAPSRWLKVKALAEAKDGLDPSLHILAKAMNSVLIYAVDLSWKVDYLLERVQEQQTSAPAHDWEDVLKKYPYLEGTDEHVQKVAHDPLMMLSRTQAVNTLYHLDLCMISLAS
jgi:hypothetical protein